MMRSLITIAALVASVSVSAGELDGKTLLCGKPQIARHIGIEFKNGQAIGLKIKRVGTKAEILDFKESEYEVSPKTVTFWGEVRLQRDTLDFEVLDEDGDPVLTLECNLGGENYREVMEMLRARKQREIDEQMRDNKI